MLDKDSQETTFVSTNRPFSFLHILIFLSPVFSCWLLKISFEKTLAKCWDINLHTLSFCGTNRRYSYIQTHVQKVNPRTALNNKSEARRYCCYCLVIPILTGGWLSYHYHIKVKRQLSNGSSADLTTCAVTAKIPIILYMIMEKIFEKIIEIRNRDFCGYSTCSMVEPIICVW